MTVTVTIVIVTVVILTVVIVTVVVVTVVKVTEVILAVGLKTVWQILRDQQTIINLFYSFLMQLAKVCVISF